MLNVSPELEEQYRELAQQLNRPVERLTTKALTQFLRMEQNKITRQKTLLDELLSSISKSETTVLYPSSCQYHDDFQTLEFDNVILCSNEFRESTKIGKVFCLKVDNNRLLGTLQRLGIKLNALVIINDGCSEGGNYECCGEMPFLYKLMPLFADEFLYFASHGLFAHEQINQNFANVVSLEPIESTDFVKTFQKHSSPDKENITGWKMKRLTNPPTVSTFKNVELITHHESIWTSDFSQFDLTFLENNDDSSQISGRNEAIRNYFIGLAAPTLKTQDCETFTTLLEMANEQKLECVAYVSYLSEYHNEICFLSRTWKGEFPKEIHLFHARDESFL
ncbi:MAG: hypothetical protein WCL34_06700 [Methylococcaceae bacterium]